MLGRDDRPERDGALEVAQGIRRGAPGRGLLRSQEAHAERDGEVVRGHRVVGDGGRRTGTRVRALEFGGIGAVQPGSFTGQEIGVHGLAEQRVPESVGRRGLGGRRGDEHLMRDGVPQRLVEISRRRAGDGQQGLVRHDVTGDRRRAGQPLRGGGQRLEPQEQHVRQACGQAALADVGGEFLGEVGVALGATQDVVHDPCGHGMPEQGGEMRVEFRAVERLELDS